MLLRIILRYGESYQAQGSKPLPAYWEVVSWDDLTGMILMRMVEDREKWNAFVNKAPSFGLLQSWEWGEFKQKMGWLVHRIAVEKDGEITAGAQMLVKTLPLGLASIAYVPRGPLCNWHDRETIEILLAELHRIARNHRAIFLKIEPPLIQSPEHDHLLWTYSFRPSRTANQPRNTIIVDLDQDLEVILSQMRKKTRKYILQAKRKGVQITVGDRDCIPAFVEIMKETGRREKFPVHSREYYELEWETFEKSDQCILLIAWHGKEPLAADLTFCFGDHAADFHGGSLRKYPELHLDYLLIWEAIKWAKSKGCKTFDLWGIPDDVKGDLKDDKRSFPHRRDGLWGVYQFKSGFSQNVVSYVGAYDYPYAPMAYTIISKILFSGNIVDRTVVSLESLKRRRA